MLELERNIRYFAKVCAKQLVAVAYPFPRAKKLKNRMRVKIDPRKGWIDLNVAIFSTYEAGTLELISKLIKPGDVFLDIGANIGVISVHAANVVGKNGVVLAFEPDSKNFERLSWARNKNSLPQLLAFPIALGDQNKMLPIRRSNTEDGGLTSLVKMEGFYEYSTVPVLTLDGFLKNFPISKIDMIKIDVEGAEHSVILGALETLSMHRPVLIVEMVNDAAVSAGKKLLDLGYDAYVIGQKSDKKIIKPRPVEVKILENDNLIFVHSSRRAVLDSL